MNRRNFLTTVFGAALAPVAVAKVLSSPPKSNDDMLTWYKGTEFFRSEVVYIPYIPLYYYDPYTQTLKSNNEQITKTYRL